jgi:hypothetical protein
MVHLATVVCTRLDLLPHFFAHYRQLGIESCLVTVHVENYGAPLYSEISDICKKYGATIVAVYAGKWFQDVNPFLYRQIQQTFPEDWFIFADVDEFQIYPGVHSVTDFMGQLGYQGYDYVEGVVIDRLARDGGFPEVDAGESIWRQFPLAAMLTYPLLHANILKIVAAKGSVKLGGGQHFALNGKGCPPKRAYIPVYHFKWSKDVADRLRARIDFYKSAGDILWEQSDRFLAYYQTHDGKIDVSDTRLWVEECGMIYPRWKELCDFIFNKAVEYKLRSPAWWDAD